LAVGYAVFLVRAAELNAITGGQGAIFFGENLGVSLVPFGRENLNLSAVLGAYGERIAAPIYRFDDGVRVLA
jgi:hypothetical protein